MLKIAICDDEKVFTSKIEKIIKDTATDHGIQVSVDVFFDGAKLIEYMKLHEVAYDLIFLDIEMEELDGIETAKRIREFDDLVYLIYVTSHESYAVEAYEVEPFSFIVKPIQEEKVVKKFLRVYEKINKGMAYIGFKSRNDYRKVLLNEVMYFESDKRLIYIHLSDGSIEQYYGKLNDIEDKMKQTKKDFWRIHRSFLVNARYIKVKEYNKVILTNGETLNIGEDRRKDINLQYASMIERDMIN